MFGECSVCLATLDQFLLTGFAGFGRRKGANSLWQCAIYAIVWSIWLECNPRTFTWGCVATRGDRQWEGQLAASNSIPGVVGGG